MMQILTSIADKIIGNPDKVYFPNAGSGDNILKEGISIDRVLFTIPGTDFDVYWYGFLIGLGMLLAVIYGFKRMKSVGIDPDRAMDAVLSGIVGAIFGARLYYVIFNDRGVTFKDFFNTRNGGLAIYGGLIGAILVGSIVLKIKKVKISPMLDVAAPCFFIGQCIGRWGNFFNQEAFGSNTNKPWGMISMTTANYISANNPELDPFKPVHPCFLYESLLCLAGFIILHFYFKHRKFDGEVFLMYIGIYGLGRFFIESTRTDSLYIGTMKVSQFVAAVCVSVSVIGIIVKRGMVRRQGDYKFFKDTAVSKLQLAEYESAGQLDKEKKELKKKISQAKSDGKDTKELEKEFDEKFGEKSKEIKKQKLLEAQRKDKENQNEDENYVSVLADEDDDSKEDKES